MPRSRLIAVHGQEGDLGHSQLWDRYIQRQTLVSPCTAIDRSKTQGTSSSDIILLGRDRVTYRDKRLGLTLNKLSMEKRVTQGTPSLGIILLDRTETYRDKRLGLTLSSHRQE
jgi:hypothetical protein